ncbi:MAG TPA: hypothetical protein VJ969_10385 [Desulfopila sp.]|nr:hypothetical protein [Desulfopila sp.]
MSNFVTREEVELLRQRLGRAEIHAHIAVNLAYIALRFCPKSDEVLAALEKSYEAGLTELTFSRATDEDIEFYRSLYSSYMEQIRSGDR